MKESSFFGDEMAKNVTECAFKTIRQGLDDWIHKAFEKRVISDGLMLKVNPKQKYDTYPQHSAQHALALMCQPPPKRSKK